MAETLGTLATILQLVDTALKAREYIQDFRHAPQEQQKLLSEMDDLRLLLTELQTRISTASSSDTLQTMERPLAAFKGAMEQFTEKLRPAEKPLSKVAKQLKWTLWTKTEAKEYLEKFEQFKSLLNSWLVLSVWDVGRRHRRDQDTAQRMQVIAWLSPINFFLRHADIAAARQLGTGGWLLENPRFKKWVSDSGGRLWCSGIPGAGKTVLASMVVDHLSTQSGNANVGIACIYLNHKESDAQTPSNLLAGLWRQLVLGKSITAGQALYQRHAEKGTKPSLDEVREVLCFTISDWSKVYIIVDAVDEYGEDQRRILLEFLAALGPTVNLMITSRPHIALDASLPNVETVEISADAEDIQKYVDTHINLSSRLSRHVRTRPELREEIQSKIASSVDGMFLMAKLHIESLSTKSTIKAVREALENLPKDLKTTYDDTMKRIEAQNTDDREIAHSVLTWVANAKRVLTVAELRDALAIEPGDEALDRDNLLDIEIILAVCAGLVIVDANISVVRIVHYTAQHYFDSIQADRFPNAHTDITSRCLTYLSFKTFHALGIWLRDPRDADELFDQHTLLNYILQYCLVHAVGPPELHLRNEIIAFLGWAYIWNQIYSPKEAPWNYPAWPLDASPLWVSAASNLMEITRHLLTEGSPSTKDVSEALFGAAFYGHLEIVQLLIQKGADIKSLDDEYNSILQAASASYNDNPSVVRLLIDSGVDVNVQGGRYGNALQAASATGNDNIVELLIQNGAQVNAQGGHYGNALHAASTYGFYNIADLLIKNGADPNSMGGEYGNALHAASVWGHHKIIQLFIANGVDLNAPGGKYGSALHAASYWNRKNIVHLLIDNGADVNAQSGKHGTPVQAALIGGHDDIVKLLVENGAHAEVHGRKHKSPRRLLHVSNMIRLHLENGEDSEGEEYSFSNMSNSIRMHLENEEDSEGQEYSALPIAISRGQRSVVLGSGANVRALGDGGEVSGAAAASRRKGREGYFVRAMHTLKDNSK